jgi:hypothetical protein
LGIGPFGADMARPWIRATSRVPAGDGGFGKIRSAYARRGVIRR